MQCGATYCVNASAVQFSDGGLSAPEISNIATPTDNSPHIFVDAPENHMVVEADVFTVGQRKFALSYETTNGDRDIMLLFYDHFDAAPTMQV